MNKKSNDFRNIKQKKPSNIYTKIDIGIDACALPMLKHFLEDPLMDIYIVFLQ